MLHRDCIFYKYLGEANWSHKKNGDIFCSFDLYNEGSDILTAKLSWIDPIKIRDKIITSEKKQLEFLIFPTSKTICIFGGSESHIAFALSKMLSFFSISFEKIEVFKIYKKYFRKSIEYQGFVLTSFDISKEEKFKEVEYNNILVDSSDENQFSDYFDKNLVNLVILFKEKKLYFSMDANSVLSFFDTDNVIVIHETCKRIVDYFEDN